MSTPAGCAADLLAAIDALDRAAAVACGAWERLSGDQREAVYLKLEGARKKLAIIDAEYLQARAVDAPIADAKVPQVLASAQRISRAEARRRRAAYRRLVPGCGAAGRAGDQDYMPCLRRKVAAGVVGADAVEKVDRVLRGFPASVQAELTKAADPHIAELVEHVEVDDLDHLAPMLRAMLGIDDPYTDADRKRARDVRVGVQEHDGMSRISGRLTPHLAALIKRLAADHGGPGDLLGDGAKDDRSPGQRLHDALEAALAAGYGPGEWAGAGDDGHGDAECGVTGPGVGRVPLVDPDFGARADTAFEHTIDEAAGGSPATDGVGGSGGCGGIRGGGGVGVGGGGGGGGAAPGPRSDRPVRGDPPRRRGRLQPARGTTSIVVVATLEQLQSMSGMVVADTNVRMSVAEAVENCDARNLFLEVLDFRGQPLYLGRSRRRGSLAQYLALLGAEGMSSAPGSSAPAAWCHIHHTEGWRYGGGTDIDELTLVDAKTHANVDDSRTNPDRWWTRKGAGADEPRIVWLPPRSQDPKRRARENRHPAGWANPGRKMRRKRQKDGRQ